MDLYEGALRVTFVLVLASLCLLLAGFAGLSGSLVLVGAALVATGGLFALRTVLDTGPTVLGHDLGAYGRVLWAGPAVAAVVCLFFLGATPAELQTLGGLVGLAGMANYFLRPLYGFGYKLGRRVVGRNY